MPQHKLAPLDLIQKLTDVKPHERALVGWSLLYIMTLFLAYYVLRPIRDELGVSSGVENLPWLFTGTLITMLALNPVYSYIVKRYSRKRFIAIAYRFFAFNLAVFALLIAKAPDAYQIWVGRSFFIWVSVFNLFVISVFWSFIEDVFTSGQGKRLFGILSAGATIGGLLGSAITSGLVAHVSRTTLLLISMVLLEVAVYASGKLANKNQTISLNEERQSVADNPVGGSVFAGMLHTFRSPYLLGIACFVMIYSFTSTFLYFQQANIAQVNFTTSEARVAFFANIDFWVNAATLFFQLFLTGRMMMGLGVLFTLCALPGVSILGFAGLAGWPTVAVFVVAQVARRVANFALARPAREVLFTSVPREDRYKAKNFIDTVIYRGGDQVASWGYTGLIAIGFGVSQIAYVGIPLSLIWLILAAWLGKKHCQQEKLQEQEIPAETTHRVNNALKIH